MNNKKLVYFIFSIIGLLIVSFAISLFPKKDSGTLLESKIEISPGKDAPRVAPKVETVTQEFNKGICAELTEKQKTMDKNKIDYSFWFNEFLKLDESNSVLYEKEVSQSQEQIFQLINLNLQAKAKACLFARKLITSFSDKDLLDKKIAIAYVKRAMKPPGLNSLKIEIQILQKLARLKWISISDKNLKEISSLLKRVSLDINNRVESSKKLGADFSEYMSYISRGDFEKLETVPKFKDIEKLNLDFISKERQHFKEYNDLIKSVF
jgi:hypothetical protein